MKKYLFVLMLVAFSLGLPKGHASAPRKLRVYLAGPEVFLTDAAAVGEQKKRIAASYGFEPLFPLDNAIENAGSPRALGIAIFKANVSLMEKADLIIANITPFRGPSADPGTAFEIGYMTARGKPVIAYSNDPRRFLNRAVAYYGSLGKTVTSDAQGFFRDPEGNAIENFDMHDNLMLEAAVIKSRMRVAKSFEEALKLATALQKPAK